VTCILCAQYISGITSSPSDTIKSKHSHRKTT